jgi:hypothetical protein
MSIHFFRPGLSPALPTARSTFGPCKISASPHESLQISDSVSCMAVAPESGESCIGDDNGHLHSASTGQNIRRKQVHQFDSTDTEQQFNLSHYGTVTAHSTQKTTSSSTGTSGGAVHKGFLLGPQGLALTCGVD